MIYTLMAVVFILGYLAIALEHNLHVDKAASALLTAVLVWTLLVFGVDTLFADHATHAATEGLTHGALLNTELRHHLAEIAEILFFLMGAMVIVELIDAHDGFDVVTSRINTTNATSLLWIIGTLTFFFSALLDNLTTTIVMVSLLRKLVTDKTLRWWFAGIIIVCANAGGAWSPIGDVTTTMLWIGNQVTASRIMVDLIVPSIIAAVIPLAILSIKLKGQNIQKPIGLANTALPVNSNYLSTNPHQQDTVEEDEHTADVTNETTEHHVRALPIRPRSRTNVLILGLGALAFVPIFKTVTHLPPYMGILFGVAILWIYTELLHHDKEQHIKK